ncbi:Elongator complex protein 5 [Xylariaceae sp. FL1272]|nr:Elongator complex protein 5 [Xylariaceae sp. FL1272]
MASSSTTAHARSHALLLAQKLLNLRDSASPLTLVLDTLEQSGKPILREFMNRAAISKSKIIYLSYATLKRPPHASTFIRARGKSPESLRSEITSHYPPGHSTKTLLIIDELNPLAASLPNDITLFLTSLITSPSISLITLYHTDIPLPLPQTTMYTPHPLTVLTHFATAVLRTTNLSHTISRQRALNRSQPEPDFGLDEGKEGVLIGLRNNHAKDELSEGLVLEMELRRRSGRSVAEKFIVIPPPSLASPNTTPTKADIAKLYLLSDHPVFQTTDPGAEGEEEPESTFNLGLTEKQRRDREGIVLPYFDAQTDVGAGEGGRILYEMGREDDFDDEEDEI